MRWWRSKQLASKPAASPLEPAGHSSHLHESTRSRVLFRGNIRHDVIVECRDTLTRGAVVTRWIVCLGILACVPAKLPAAESTADLDRLMESFFGAADVKGRLQAAEQIVAIKPDPLEVERKLRAGRRYSKEVKTGWQILENLCTDGKKRPYHLYVPVSYDPEHGYPVRVILHGYVNRPDLMRAEQLAASRQSIQKDAEARGFIVLIPLGQRGATWFDDVGVANILGQVGYVKQHYNVDENRVTVGGFSDGGSGSYRIALLRPTPWAGFVPLSGSLSVAGAGPEQCYPRNLANRRIHAANGGLDHLFPSAIERRFIEQLRRYGTSIEWSNYPHAGHDDAYRHIENPRILHFLAEAVRNPRTSGLTWESASPQTGRCDWVRIDEIKDVGSNAGPEISNLAFDRPPNCAFALDNSFQGPGIRVASLETGSILALGGLQAGDVITRMEGVPIKTDADLREVYFNKLLAKVAGDEFTGEYMRDGKAQSYKVTAPRAAAGPLYPRLKPTGLIRVHAEGNRVEVQVRGVARYSLFLNSQQFDFTKPLQVTTNGTQSFKAVPATDVGFMLRQAAADDDRTMVYRGIVQIIVAPKGAKAGEKR